MPTDLAQHIANTRLVDTHEHLRKDRDWVTDGPDILQDLFGNYVPADLITAGATGDALQKLTDASDPDFGARYEGIRAAFETARFTGYGEAVRILAHEVYGMADFSGDELQKAQKKLEAWRQPGGRHELLSTMAKLDHVQTDDFCWPCVPDESGVDFFLYDLSWAGFCNGQIDPKAIEDETGVAVKDLASIKSASQFGQLDKHQVGQGFDGEIGDPDGGNVSVEMEPLVALGEFQGGRVHRCSTPFCSRVRPCPRSVRSPFRWLAWLFGSRCRLFLKLVLGDLFDSSSVSPPFEFRFQPDLNHAVDQSIAEEVG